MPTPPYGPRGHGTPDTADWRPEIGPEPESIEATVEAFGAKPWYQSRAIIGGLVAILASILGLWGIDLDQAAATEIALNAAPLIGGALAVWGRVKATRPIRRKKQVLDHAD